MIKSGILSLLNMKSSTRSQLNIIVKQLRNVSLPTSPILGSGSLPRCKDGRRHKRVSTTPLATEKDFDDFLMSNPLIRISGFYLRFLNSLLRDNHRIVMTHGDLRPGNVMVEMIEGEIKLVGLIDWEMGGTYSEYWEYMKALNTVSPLDEMDWAHHLPEAIGDYPFEWAIDSLIDGVTA